MIASAKIATAVAAGLACAFAPAASARTVSSAASASRVYTGAAAVSDDHVLSYTVALTPGNKAGLDAKMLDTSVHGGPWLTESQLTSYTRPKDEHAAAVKAHLVANGVKEADITSSKWGDELHVQSTAKAANSAWKTSLRSYTHNTHGHSIIRAAKGYTIPDELHEAIVNVHPFTSFPNVRPSAPVYVQRDEKAVQLAARAANDTCDGSAVTTECLKNYYGAGNFTAKPQDNETDVLVFGFLGQYVSPSDLTAFMQNYTNQPNYTIPITNAGNSTNNASKPGSEAMLDVEMVGGIIAPLHAEFLSFGTDNASANEPFQQAFEYVLSTYNDTSRPGVITASYVDDEASYSPADAQHLCDTIQKVTALGTSVLYGSGDNGLNGVQAAENETCQGKFNPTLPGDCPYVLAVGGTQGFPEVVVDGSSDDGFYAGAGFSASGYFARPSYQNDSVTKYLNATGSPHASYYNASNRAYPDVAAMSLNLVVVVEGQTTLIGGTSAATPIFASMLALLNNQRKQSGKGRVGWVNPAFYAHPETLRDITSGEVGGCPEPGLTFNATTGWDLASGLGTPLFGNWSALP